MSLITRNLIIVAGCAASAICVPFFLLRSEAARVSPQPPLIVTALNVAPVSGFNAALSAPVFSPLRTPADVVVGTPEADTAPQTEPAPKAVPLLVGLIGRTHGKSVALIRGSDGQTVVAKPGTNIDGWELATIGRDRVTFVQNGERHEAALDFSNKAPGAGPPSGSPAPSALTTPPPSTLSPSLPAPHEPGSS